MDGLIARFSLLPALTHKLENERWQVFRALCAVDYEEQLAKLTELRHEGTGEWFTRATAFKAWTESATSSGLCCRGIRMTWGVPPMLYLGANVLFQLVRGKVF